MHPAPWRPDLLLRVLLAWSALTFLPFWLPTIRGFMDGPTYQWGIAPGLSGSGVSGAYWFPVLGSAAALGYLWLGYRGARHPFPLLLLGWTGLLAAVSVTAAIRNPHLFRLRGDTLGLDLSLAWVGPTLFGTIFLLSLFWVVRRRPAAAESRPRWMRRNTLLALLVLSIFPVQWLLLRGGPPHGTTDQIGVILTLIQWGLVSAALFPWRPRSTPPGPATDRTNPPEPLARRRPETEHFHARLELSDPDTGPRHGPRTGRLHGRT